ncbi:Mrp/NBP35 family ATP-binding protein [Blastopirellula sp. JC732]|uniref:Iron-sulfur cluster carrier protein n=1 Tax=Blastopirellula sediminis TaxID=2894196 RepID=A0A9X1MQL7_9BACT|nr:Mrp/NBP35 family ATP-binding protein [Blastopirellula sediminis]MCC9605147.1 Mrp/NBP35 family ATP-binding protein [Blastopirellula sediminis]MCC9631553.1 Mrp/NBP35 family ATP-binding protein [Blastopirellula sediminis]
MSDSQPQVADVIRALEKLTDPLSGRPVTKTDQVKEIDLRDGALTFTLELTTHSAPLWEETKQKAIDLLKAELPSLKEIQVNLAEYKSKIEAIGQVGLTVRSVIAVGSGKGGVGKSTVATSLAFALKDAGAKVGLLDADVYGPSVPHLLGLSGRPELIAEKKIAPMERDGVKVMSMGFLVEPDRAVIWRGPMLHGAITQFLRDTAWGELDYLIIDMPPGTGDIALTLSQLLPLTGAVVVCTPQDVALLDAVKAIAMFNTVKIPVLGVVENMSGFICPDTGKEWDIFGKGGAKKKAEEMNVPFLGDVPITISIREKGDQGAAPQVVKDELTAPHFQKICQNLVRGLAETAAANPPMPTLTVL